MKILLTLIFLVTNLTEIYLAQTEFNTQNLYNLYPNYKESSIKQKRFKHSDLKTKINQLKQKNKFRIETAGTSLEDRQIFLLSIGEGKTKVLLWSQMHGDESTATMALLDIFNFLTADDEFNDFRKKLFSELTLYFIPMLNPDGAERFRRRNALDIDLNRDALRLQFPESKILKTVRDTLNADFGFNLHDQNTRYSAGNSYRSATISFLAPAYNYEKEINDVRGNTMKVIADIYEKLTNFIPGHIAKYNDDFEPRAFGDNFIKWGTSSVLIESGGWKNDEEKQFIRKLNFIAILSGLNSIATKNYESASIETYNKIPFNDNLIFDVLLRKLKYNYNDKNYVIDVGINKHEINTNNYSNSYFSSEIEDWGDLSIFYGYEDIDLEGFEIRESSIKDIELVNIDSIDINKLISEGIGYIKIDSLNKDFEYSNIPFNLVKENRDIDLSVGYGKNATFTIWKDDKICFNVINGFVYDINSENHNFGNGLIFK